MLEQDFLFEESFSVSPGGTQLLTSATKASAARLAFDQRSKKR